MRAVLGEDACQALAKAAERSEALGGVIGPRTVIGWATLAARWDYDGQVPGIEDSQLTFEKGENHQLTGSIRLGQEELEFENATVPHLAAMLCVGLGCQKDFSKSLKDSDLAGLGENIDLLVKARVVNLLKAMKEISACEECGKRRYVVVCKCKGKKKVEKTELPGQQAKPGAPIPPTGFTAPTKTAPKPMQPPRVKLTKAMTETKCSVCEASQFDRRGEFKGCYCLRDLARFAKSERDGEDFVVTFSKEWTKSSIALLMDIVGAQEE
jgi:hypothetical protein